MLALLLCAVAAPAVADTAPQAAIVPRPQSVEFGGDSLGLAAEFKFVATLLGKRSSTLTAALTRFGALLSPGGGAAPAAADATASGAAPAPALASCSVHVAGSSLALDLSTDESYTLTISAAGACGVSAPTIYGAMHGMESFVQLADRATCTVPTVAIADRPRFPFRGAMIVSRFPCSYRSLVACIPAFFWRHPRSMSLDSLT
jgi:hexosaminidase